MTPRRLIIAFACTLGFGCAGEGWSDVATGSKISEGRWHPNGVMVFVGPGALERYASSGSGLLGGVFGSGFTVEVLGSEVTVDGQPVVMADTPVVVRPAELKLTLLEEQNLVRVTIGFHPAALVVELDGAPKGCNVTVPLGPFEVAVDMEARRDLSGHITLVTLDDGLTLNIPAPEPTLGAGCAELGQSMRASVLGFVGAAFPAALASKLGHGSAFVTSVEGLAQAMTAAHMPGKLERSFGPASDPGRFVLALQPSSSTGEEPVMLVSAGNLVVPLRVGVDATPGACAASADLPKPGPVSTASPDLDANESDVAVAIHESVLRASLAAFARGGGLCRRAGFGQAGGLTLGDVRGFLEQGQSIPFDDLAPVSLVLQGGAAPALAVQASDPATIGLVVPKLHVEVFVQAFGSEWLLARETASLSLLNSTPGLVDGPGAGQTLILSGGEFTVDPVGGGGVSDPEGLYELVVGQLTSGLTLFGLPAAFPYPLVGSKFIMQGEHLILYANLDTSVAPRLALLESRLSEPSARDVPGRSESPLDAACSAGHGSGSAPLIPLMAALFALLCVRARRSAFDA